MKISKEEKALIKAYVNLMNVQCKELDELDSSWLEVKTTSIINNKDGEYRIIVREFIEKLIIDINGCKRY